jgi:hypothetical protein
MSNETSSASEQSARKYLHLSKALADFENCYRRGLGGIAARFRPEENGAMAPFYRLQEMAREQAVFVKQALQKYMSELQPASLDIAAANLHASRAKAAAALRFAIETKGEVNGSEVELSHLHVMLDVTGLPSVDDKYLQLINVLSVLESRCKRAFLGAGAVAWPEASGTLYEMAKRAREQACLARLALEAYITNQRAAVLVIADKNLQASRMTALEALTFAIEKIGDVNSLVDCRRQIEDMLTCWGWSI